MAGVLAAAGLPLETLFPPVLVRFGLAFLVAPFDGFVLLEPDCIGFPP